MYLTVLWDERQIMHLCYMAKCYCATTRASVWSELNGFPLTVQYLDGYGVEVSSSLESEMVAPCPWSGHIL